MITREREALRKVPGELFPDFGLSALQLPKVDLYDGLTDRQRVAARYSFDRFFTYSTSEDPIQDKEIVSLLDHISSRAVPEIASEIQSMIERAGLEAFIDRIGENSCDLRSLRI